MKDEYINISEIGNTYGTLEIKIENGIYYWGIGDWSGTQFVQITKKLYETIKKETQ